MNPVIQANDVTIGYKNHPVIHHFSGEIDAGQFVGIFGPNGAGKTTLLLTLLGLVPPLAGQLTVLGTTPACGHMDIGYVPQSLTQLNVGISGYALLEATINGGQFGVPRVSRQQHAAISEVIEQVGAAAYAHRPFMQLSGGEKRRLLLAQALLGHPRIMLLDEPLANLDPHYQYAFIELLEKIRQRSNITLLLTAHDMNPLLGMMTHTLYLARGKAALGTVAEVMTADVLSALYGSPMEVISHNSRLFVIHSSTGQTENVTCHSH